jgi:hypothetical protein
MWNTSGSSAWIKIGNTKYIGSAVKSVKTKLNIGISKLYVC